MNYTVHPDEIINECRRRIEAVYPPTVQSVVIATGGHALDRMRDVITRLRACQDGLLAMNPIPHSYRSDHYWVVPNGAADLAAPVAAAAPAVPAAPQVIVVPQAAPTSVSVTLPPQAGMAQTLPMPPYPYQQPTMVQPVPVPHPVAQPIAIPGPLQPQQTPPVVGVGRPTPPASAPPAAPASPRAGSEPVAASRGESDVWDEKREALYQTCKAALEGNGEAYGRVEALAKMARIPVRSFCERVISERARSLHVFKRLTAAE